MEEMMMKRRKLEEDRISELSDDVLCLILSFLSIKEAIVTSSLSTRWRFLWSMVPSLDIECLKPIMKYHGSVYIFLGLRRTEKITRFDLNCKCNDYDCCCRYVQGWVPALVDRKVEQVNISLCMSHTSVLSFPALFTCTTIVALKIKGCLDLFIPSSVHLPNVKTLHLHVNECFPFPNVRYLIYGSPALELFHLKQKRYKHHFLELKIVRNSRDIRVFQRKWFYDLLTYELVIQSDRDYDFISDFVEDRWPNIVKANVYMTVYDGNKLFHVKQIVTKILQVLCNVEFLSLCFRIHIDPSTLNLPPFKNLVMLRLSLKKADSLYMKFLAKCLKLEVFEVNIIDDRYGIYQRCRYRINGNRVREPDLSIVSV